MGYVGSLLLTLQINNYAEILALYQLMIVKKHTDWQVILFLRNWDSSPPKNLYFFTVFLPSLIIVQRDFPEPLDYFDITCTFGWISLELSCLLADALPVATYSSSVFNSAMVILLGLK